MNPWRHVVVLFRRLTRAAIIRILRHRVEYRYPSLIDHPTAVWDYGYADLDAITLGTGVNVQAFTEIVVRKRATFSAIPGRLEIGDGVFIGAGVNIRAAGGAITIGAGSAIGQHTVLVAANHRVERDAAHIGTPWDESRTGVQLGRNVWVGAGCVLLPGTVVGDNAVVAAGAVVTGTVPPDELWGGVPARTLKALRSATEDR